MLKISYTSAKVSRLAVPATTKSIAPVWVSSEEAYHAVMNDPDYMENVYDSTD